MPAPSPPTERLRIGASLEEARRERGLSIDEAAALTKIRAKYLRALEAEEWGELPSHAYAKGFMRTYAQMLGLDADELVDRYRRELETADPLYSLVPLGDPVLEERRGLPGLERKRGRRGLVLGGVCVALLAGVLVLVLAGGLGDDDASHQAHHPTAAHTATARHHQPAGAPAGPVTLSLHALQGAQVCLVGDGRALIDSQALPPGAKAGPFNGRRFRIDLSSFGGGALRLRIDGHATKLVAKHRSSYLIHRNGVKRTGYRGPRCP